MEKPADVTIEQITAAATGNSVSAFGLGGDQKMYTWDYSNHVWRLWA